LHFYKLNKDDSISPEKMDWKLTVSEESSKKVQNDIALPIMQAIMK